MSKPRDDEHPGPPLIHIITSSARAFRNFLLALFRALTFIRVPPAFEEIEEHVLSAFVDV